MDSPRLDWKRDYAVIATVELFHLQEWSTWRDMLDWDISNHHEMNVYDTTGLREWEFLKGALDHWIRHYDSLFLEWVSHAPDPEAHEVAFSTYLGVKRTFERLGSAISLRDFDGLQKASFELNDTVRALRNYLSSPDFAGA